MKIARITLFRLTLSLSKPYRLSGGRLLFTELDSTVVKIESDDGLVGWGEGCPWGHSYLPAHGSGIRAAAEILAPALLGEDPRHLDKVNLAMDLALPGHLYAKAPLDIACWDLFGQATGLPIVDLLGGRHGAPVPIASSISTGSPVEMAEEIEAYRTRGYRVHSAKVGGDAALDVARIRHLAELERPGELIFYDVNRAWTLAEAVQVMTAVSDLPVLFEQPCETLEQCRAVAQRTGQSISIDERLETLDDLVRIATEGIAEVINIKLNRVGGLTRARRLRDLALARGIRMLTMDTGGTVLADTGVQHFAQSIPPAYRLGTWLCQEMVTLDPAPGRGARNSEGTAEAPDLPGLGVAPDPELLGESIAVFE